MKTKEEERQANNLYHFEWYHKNKKKINEYQKKYYQKNKEKLSAKTQLDYANNREKYNAANKVRAQKRRLIVLTHYSNNQLKCTCCGEEQYEFLCIDHINNGGNKHRKEVKTKTIYQWLITNNYPSGFQVLCHNCNMAKSLYGQCPHNL
jgi:ATP-dependent helicase YprA (DUF1998 family)